MSFAALGFLFGLIPRWGWLLAASAVVAALYGWHAVTVHQARKAGREEVRAEWAAATQAALDHRREVEKMRRQANQGVTDGYRKELAHAEAAASAARGELDRLRDLAAGSDRTDDPAASAGADAAPILRVLGECAGEVVRLAQESDRLAAQVRGLQGYASEVCVAPR